MFFVDCSRRTDCRYLKAGCSRLASDARTRVTGRDNGNRDFIEFIRVFPLETRFSFRGRVSSAPSGKYADGSIINQRLSWPVTYMDVVMRHSDGRATQEAKAERPQGLNQRLPSKKYCRRREIRHFLHPLHTFPGRHEYPWFRTKNSLRISVVFPSTRECR